MPVQVGVRLDDATRQALDAYIKRTGLTISTAVRLLLATALAAEAGASPTDALHAASYREGVFRAIAAIKEAIERATDDTMRAAHGPVAP